jgi:hypothetical protein
MGRHPLIAHADRQACICRHQGNHSARRRTLGNVVGHLYFGTASAAGRSSVDGGEASSVGGSSSGLAVGQRCLCLTDQTMPDKP